MGKSAHFKLLALLGSSLGHMASQESLTYHWDRKGRQGGERVGKESLALRRESLALRRESLALRRESLLKGKDVCN